MSLSIVVMGAMIYFIHEQFEFSTVRKINYFFLPVMSLIQCFNHFSVSRFNIIVLAIIIVISLCVGFYQAKHSLIREEKEAKYFFMDANLKERPIYEKVVKVKGGRHYIYGWLVIFGLQIVLQFFVTKNKLSASEIQHQLFSELLDDILSVYRVLDLKDNNITWYVWALYGSSTLFYTYFLARKSTLVHEKLFASKPIIHKKR